MQSSHHLIGSPPFNTTILIIFIEISPQLDLISSSRCPTSTTFTSRPRWSDSDHRSIMDMTTISSYNHQHATFWINTNLNQKKKHHEKFHKTQQKIISRQHLGKTCKPRHNIILEFQILIHQKTNTKLGTTKKRTSAEQNWRIRASDVCREVGRRMQIRIIIEKPPRRTGR